MAKMENVLIYSALLFFLDLLFVDHSGLNVKI
jgi:hypothetical protein